MQAFGNKRRLWIVKCIGQNEGHAIYIFYILF